MYRKALLIAEDLDELVGKLIRLEVMTGHGPVAAALITSHDGRYLYYTAGDGQRGSLRVIEGTYVVAATDLSAVIPCNEQWIPRVLWRQRFGERTRAIWNAN